MSAVKLEYIEYIIRLHCCKFNNNGQMKKGMWDMNEEGLPWLVATCHLVLLGQLVQFLLQLSSKCAQVLVLSDGTLHLLLLLQQLLLKSLHLSSLYIHLLTPPCRLLCAVLQLLLPLLQKCHMYLQQGSVRRGMSE